MPLKFIKLHGFGNDYIVLEAEDLRSVPDLGAFARSICDRHYGAGSDGIAIVGPPASGADFNVRIFNPDGSEANLSGNGTRCAAAYLHYTRRWSNAELRLSTRAGTKLYVLGDHKEHGQYVFESELGQPRFDPPSIPMRVDARDKVIDYPVTVAGVEVKLTALQLGNPISCIFVNDFDDLDWRSIGKTLETHELFPERTNVVFVRVENRNAITLRIWERGVGETNASGTCSCAGALAAMVKNETDRKVVVTMPGGQADIQWRGDGEVVLTGAAEVIYAGEWLAQGQKAVSSRQQAVNKSPS